MRCDQSAYRLADPIPFHVLVIEQIVVKGASEAGINADQPEASDHMLSEVLVVVLFPTYAEVLLQLAHVLCHLHLVIPEGQPIDEALEDVDDQVELGVVVDVGVVL